MSIPLILAAVVSTASGSCSWAHPGANPYRGDPMAALSDFRMSPETRQKLKALMAAHQYTDMVKITRDDISGNGRYTDLRDMHSGHGNTCHGAVDRSAWSDTLEERGLVYCAGETCVIVPTVCNNVSLVTRRPEQAPAAAAAPPEDTSPIDIEPAAGGGGPMASDTTPTSGTAFPLAATSPPADSFVGTPSPPFGGGGGPIFGGGPCCAPIGGGGGGGVTPSTPVPEAPSWWMMVAGLGLLSSYAALRRSKPRSTADAPRD